MMNTWDLQLCKYLGFVFFPMSFPLAQKETSFETNLYWFQLTNLHIAVIQYLHFLYLFSFLSIPCNNPSQKNQPYKLMRKKVLFWNKHRDSEYFKSITAFKIQIP